MNLVNLKEWIAPLATAATMHGVVSALPIDLSSGQQDVLKPEIIFRLQPPTFAKKSVIEPTPKKALQKKRKQPEQSAKPQKEPKKPAVTKRQPKPEPIAEVAVLPKSPSPAPRPTARRIDLRPYGKLVYTSVNRIKKYPVVAKRLGLTGRTLIQLTVDINGNLLKAPILYRSSGHDLLDREALRMVQKAAPYPPLPSQFDKNSATIVIPIDFSLTT